jgi:TldD protein
LHHFIPISSLLANNYTLKRRDFIQMAGLGTGAFMLPGFAMGRTVSPEAFLNPGDDVAVKKRLADAALNAAKSKGASYADVRIGRYLNQYVITREDKVQNIVNTESYGVGVRVIANGCWGFAAVVDAKMKCKWRKLPKMLSRLRKLIQN